MRAVLFDRYGPPDVLALAEVPEPRPGPGQALIQVSHSGINFAEVMFRRGQIPVALPHSPGLEAVGTILEVGPDVEDLPAGTRVAALTLGGGGQADYVVAPTWSIVPLTGDLAGLDSAVAAGSLCNGTTAVGAVALCGRPAPGERALVTAAAGGVGRFLVQLLAMEGVAVTAATSDHAKLDEGLRAVVSEHLTYGDLDDCAPFDLVFDSVGGATRKSIRDKVALLGRHVILGDAAQHDVQVHCDDLWFQANSVVGYNLGALAHGRPEVFGVHLRQALHHIAEGRLTVALTVITPGEIPDVHARLEERTSSGKFVVEW